MTSRLPFSGSSPIERRRDLRLRDAQRPPRRRSAPMWANWSRCSGRASAFAPASIRTAGPPGRRKRRSRSPAGGPQAAGGSRARPAASIAPVFPAETTDVGVPPLRPRGRPRRASCRASSRAASAASRPSRRPARRGRPRARRRAARGRPRRRRGSARPRSDTRRERAGDDLLGRPVAAHRVHRDPDGRHRGYGAGVESGSTSRPRYVPQVGQTRCGRFGWWHCGHSTTAGAASLCVARRLSRRAFEVFRLGTAIAAAKYSSAAQSLRSLQFSSSAAQRGSGSSARRARAARWFRFAPQPGHRAGAVGAAEDLLRQLERDRVARPGRRGRACRPATYGVVSSSASSGLVPGTRGPGPAARAPRRPRQRMQGPRAARRTRARTAARTSVRVIGESAPRASRARDVALAAQLERLELDLDGGPRNCSPGRSLTVRRSKMVTARE